MKLSGCAKLDLRPLTGTWFRAIPTQHWATRLATGHSKFTRSRFGAGTTTDPCHALLYLAAGIDVAMWEVGALLGQLHAPISNPHGTWTTLCFDLVLQSVADLTLPAQVKRIGSSTQELTGDCRFHATGPTPTQRLGAALFAVPGLEAFLAPSTKAPRSNLIVFPEKLQPGSRITFLNPASGKVESLFP